MRNLGLSEEDIRQLKFLLQVRREKDDGYMAPQIKAEKPSESRCQVCGSRITETSSMGEVGHHQNCERRETRYKGQTGKIRPSPPNAKPDRKIVADGGDQ